MSETAAQDISAAPPDELVETHGQCHHGPASGNRALALALALVFCGLAGVIAGTACLMWMAGPEIGVTPFARLESGDLAQSFIAVRRMAFLTIALGAAAFLTGFIVRPRRKRTE